MIPYVNTFFVTTVEKCFYCVNLIEENINIANMIDSSFNSK